MFRSRITAAARFSPARALATATNSGSSAPIAAVPNALKADLTSLKLNSNGSKDLYAVFRLHNMPYLVTKGDKVYLPFKLKNAEVGDSVVLNDVTTIGSPDFTYNKEEGISEELYELKASVVEITREPYYEVYRKKQRCRRLKTFPVEPFQTVLMINELKLN
ncbi:mitochondrial ribosomal protein, large subunit [Scheffersomyces xylosifermentans]|uniref:mitochondrial ribosomal protein, large subunit n=1 Tax=Scheffersomyces xylosifermentans TaxID=1304137 RepID=UPI00315C7B4B